MSEPHQLDKTPLSARFWSSMRTLILTGIAVWLPIVITVWILHFLVATVDNLQFLVPEEWRRILLYADNIPGFGVLMAVLIVILTGFFARNFLGQKILVLGDALLHRIPIVKTIYKSVKQISDNVFSGNSNAFRQAVLVEFPREGAWTIAFVTSKSPPPSPHLPDELRAPLALYVPTTPNPTSGYLIWVDSAQTRPLNLSVEEALKVVISMGVFSQSEPTARQ